MPQRQADADNQNSIYRELMAFAVPPGQLQKKTGRAWRDPFPEIIPKERLI
ncbi:hypothetical protein K3722_05875 [Leisingera caerulea]|uniref:Uncharacterized protein n=1 Tax=Leisingera caerulea TaxID=506591 RepID=A0ABY5WZA4_LEICA|nr:hypothetical protein [Leisingera caerulea]UWQ59653.1 hypothetical protein K3722_05875 [Leisingera caerulea]